MIDSNSIPDSAETRNLEDQVLASLTTILDRYRRIDSLADKMLAEDKAVKVLDANMLKLKNERAEIEQLQLRSKGIREQYRQSRPHASEAVKAITTEIGSLVQGLLMKVSQLEKHARTSCENLVPQIQVGVKAIQMKSAYGKFS